MFNFIKKFFRRKNNYHNVINILYPYRIVGSKLWVFDDLDAGLRRELFVSSFSAIIDQALKDSGIKPKDVKDGFMAIFSASFFPEADIVMEWSQGDTSGNYYIYKGLEGWLCPALYKYFDVAPKRIYAKFKKLEETGGIIEYFPHDLSEEYASLEPVPSVL